MARFLSTPSAKTTRTYKLYGTAGTYTFTTPDNVEELDVAVWGGGGAGCGYFNTTYMISGSGGGFACGTIGTFPGKQWNITVGDSQGTSSFGTALSATGGTAWNTPGTGCICTTAGVCTGFTASGGCGQYCSWQCYLSMSGGASGSPYGTGGNGVSNCVYYGSPGGAGWGLGHGSAAQSYHGGGGGSAGVAASGPGGAGTGGGTGGGASLLVYSINQNACCTVCQYGGGPGVAGVGGILPIISSCVLTGTVDSGRQATDCVTTSPFLRLDALTGGGGAGGLQFGPCVAGEIIKPSIGMDGANGGGGGGQSCWDRGNRAGNGGFGAGGGGGASGGGGLADACQGGNGGFGGGGGGGGQGTRGNGGCGGGSGSGPGNSCCRSGGQGAVLIVYDK